MRLAAGAGGVAQYLADAAGLDHAAVARLQAAVIAACKEAFKYLTIEHPHLNIFFARFADRLEVVLSHEGEDAHAPRPAAFAGVDCVQYEERGGESVTRLTKYLGKVAPTV